MNSLTPFHLAIPVTDLYIAQDFYENILECTPGRFSKQWADYSLFGHQLVLHEDKKYKGQKHFNKVDGKAVPIPHFGVVLKQMTMFFYDPSGNALEFKSFKNVAQIFAK